MRGGLINRLVLWTLVAAIGVPPAPASAAGASGKWSRVTDLKPDTRVVVTFVSPPGPIPLRTVDEESVDGWFVSAGPLGMVVHGIRTGPASPRVAGMEAVDVVIPRERVVEVAIVKDGRPWYAIPLVAAAVVGGAAIVVGVLWLTATSGTAGWPSGDDSAYGIFTIFALPVLTGIWAYRRIGGSKPSLKVIYEAPRPGGAASPLSTSSGPGTASSRFRPLSSGLPRRPLSWVGRARR